MHSKVHYMTSLSAALLIYHSQAMQNGGAATASGIPIAGVRQPHCPDLGGPGRSSAMTTTAGSGASTEYSTFFFTQGAVALRRAAGTAN